MTNETTKTIYATAIAISIVAVSIGGVVCSCNYIKEWPARQLTAQVEQNRIYLTSSIKERQEKERQEKEDDLIKYYEARKRRVNENNHFLVKETYIQSLLYKKIKAFMKANIQVSQEDLDRIKEIDNKTEKLLDENKHLIALIEATEAKISASNPPRIYDDEWRKIQRLNLGNNSFSAGINRW